MTIEFHLDTTPIHLAQEKHDVRVRADVTRAIVVVGEAGSGKSHLFADAVDRALGGTAGLRCCCLVSTFTAAICGAPSSMGSTSPD